MKHVEHRITTVRTKELLKDILYRLCKKYVLIKKDLGRAWEPLTHKTRWSNLILITHLQVVYPRDMDDDFNDFRWWFRWIDDEVLTKFCIPMFLKLRTIWTHLRRRIRLVRIRTRTTQIPTRQRPTISRVLCRTSFSTWSTRSTMATRTGRSPADLQCSGFCVASSKWWNWCLKIFRVLSSCRLAPLLVFQLRTEIRLAEEEMHALVGRVGIGDCEGKGACLGW